MTTNTKEVRPGAAGLSNAARANNVKRYALGRKVYDLQQQIKNEPANYKTNLAELDRQLAEAKKAYAACPLDFGGDNASALGVKGRKAASKARDSED